jgi:ribose 5-phosphate isomerase B
VLGATGQGEAMVANRRLGVRAAVLYTFNEEIIKLSREHNAANMLSLGASFLSESDAIRVIELWLATDFSGDERHVRRIAKIDPQ